MLSSLPLVQSATLVRESHLRHWFGCDRSRKMFLVTGDTLQMLQKPVSLSFQRMKNPVIARDVMKRLKNN